MSTAAPSPLIVEPSVSEFLKREGAEMEFQTICDLVRRCFPDLCRVEAMLREDVDEVGWWRVVLHVIVPKSYPEDLFRAEQLSYHNAFVREVPLARCSFFVILPYRARE
jgi:hypothetical protein